MKVWPFGAALRWEASNHHMLRWLKTVVVSDVEKARVMRQVGIGKTVLMQQLRPLNDAAEARHVDVAVDVDGDLPELADNRGWSAAGSENVADNNFPHEFDAHTDSFRGEDQRR